MAPPLGHRAHREVVSSNDEGGVYDERFALVSVLQELTVAALELFDPRRSADGFLERLAERLGCFVTLLIRLEPAGRPELHGASGLSAISRMLPIDPDRARELLTGKCGFDLPYPELKGRELACWRFPVLTPPGAVLILLFQGEPALPARYKGMLRRLAEILGRVLEHRTLFARSIESERRLDEKKTIIECLSEASPDGVLFIDSSREIFFFNRRFLDMWGVSTNTSAGALDRLLDACAAKVVSRETFLSRAKEIRERPDQEAVDEIRLLDGRIFERHSRPVRTREGISYGYALFFRDITERKREEAARENKIVCERKARTSAEEALQARDEFLSIASHELRTPVTALHLATQQLVRGAQSSRTELPAATMRALETSRRQTERLVRLVDALLDVSRIRAGRLQLELDDLDLAEVVREVVTRLDYEIERSGSVLVVHAPETVRGRWDRSRLDQVATNLISNAIKYGRGERIDVSVEGDEHHARLVVQDRGIGIEPDQTGRLFQRFERAVSSRHYGGLGLGLYIVRQIVEMHGGAVDVVSEPNTGSTFTVTLPRITPAPTTEPLDTSG
ncbi:MAG: ATP-binding protein [Polyangiales bacterium]